MDPSSPGQNKDIEVGADDTGRTSWTGRFIDYLKSPKRLSDLAFFSFEHYPFPPCNYNWTNLYDEPTLVSHIVDVWHEDGVPATTPLYITESNISSQSSESAVEIFGALWLADYIGASLDSGVRGVYYFHYIPEGVFPGCNHSSGNLGMFETDRADQISQPLGQFFASQLINLE